MMWSRNTAFVGSLGVILIALSFTASDASDLSTKQKFWDSSSPEAPSTTKGDEVLSSQPLQQNNNACRSNADCRNGGECMKGRNGVLFCECKNGTSGDNCEVVDECSLYPLMCGNGRDVECGYDLVTQKANCKCNNASKGFDSYLEKCRLPCTSHEDCPSSIKCRKNRSDDLKFCRCPWGTGGDRCTEEVDECKEKGLDCGNNPNVTCLEGQRGESVCHCEFGDWSVAFDYEAKDCIKCDCGGSNLGCQFFPNGTKSCYCDYEYYQKDEKCEACECGYGSNGCKSENGTKICKCWGSYLDNGGVCGKCDCGFYEIGCTFKNGQKYCSCRPGFIPANGICRSCDCGPDGNCSFVEGLKTCDCKDGYAEKPPDDSKRGSRCEPCRCGQRSTGCTFLNSNSKKCNCELGYSQKNNECSECDCGLHGECSFDYFGRKICKCKDNFGDIDGYCVECYCGYNGDCEFNEEGNKTCTCREGYGDKDGICTYCSCYALHYSVINCTFTDGKEKCLCPPGHREDFVRSCIDINECLNLSACPAKTTCKNTIGNYTCSCEDGYRPLSDQHDTKLYGCTDINECVENNACPYRDTSECSNIPGSYYCYCKEGHSHRSTISTIEMIGCEKDRSGWRVGYIVLIVICITVVCSILMLIILKRRRSSS